MAMFLDVMAGESISIGAATRITVEEKSGRRTRLRIESPEDVRKTIEPALTAPTRTETSAEAPMLRRPGLKPA